MREEKTSAGRRAAHGGGGGERGAALMLALLITFLLLSAGAALLVATAYSGTKASAASSEMQAYYAAEAGVQGVMAVLRGHRAPSPLFAANPSGGVAAANQINFRKAVTRADSNLAGDPAAFADGTPFPLRLSRWLPYDYQPPGLGYADRVTLTPGYTPLTGSAFSASLTDPDNTATVIFAVSGVFPTSTTTPQTSITVGTGNDRVTVSYAAPSSGADVTVNTSASLTLGTFTVTPANNNANNTLTNVPFDLTITQKAPHPATSSAPLAVTMRCYISGTVNNTTINVTVTFPNSSNNISGTVYQRGGTAVALTSTAATAVPVTVTAAAPQRLLAHVTGYGPQGAHRHMKMLVSRFAFDYTASAAVTLRGSDDALPSAMTFNIGSSSQYKYSGNDNAGGPNLPAFCVTNSVDYNVAVAAVAASGGGQVSGTSAVRQVAPASLPSFLLDAPSAREAVDTLRKLAYNDEPTLNRYFTTASPPTDYGANAPLGLFTFVDGDATLPPSGGAGMLVVTGTLDMRGAAAFRGVVLVLGGGTVLRNGAGNGTTLGTMFVARFGAAGGFQPVHFDSNGSGTGDLLYDSLWVENGLLSAGPRIIGISEY